MKTRTKEFFEKLSPERAYEVLKEGNKRFVSNLKINRNLLQQVNETANGQNPFAAVLSCMDSRTSAELVFDQGLGDIFSIRVAGNVVNEDVLGSMEYACKVVGSKLIVVLGHTRCGAIHGACDGVEMGHLTGLLEKIKPAIEKTRIDEGSLKAISSIKVTQANVLLSIREIIDRSSIIRSLYRTKKIGIVGGIYNVENGQVEFIKQMFGGAAQENLPKKLIA